MASKGNRLRGTAILLFGSALLLGVLLPAFCAAQEAEKPSPVAGAELEADPHGVIEVLPAAAGAHWVWISDRLLRHSLLFDGDTGRMLGGVDVTAMLSGRGPVFSRSREELYVVEEVYSRGHRGERRDFVTIYDAKTLAVTGEIEIPPKVAQVSHGMGLVALLDEDRFLLAFNQTPGSSVSVIDLENRTMVGEIDVAGCALVYPTGPASFGSLCGDGRALKVRLKEDGTLGSMSHSETIFDVVKDPLSEKGVRYGDRWLFTSFAGWLHEIDFSADAPALKERWSLFSDDERAGAWRVGGIQHLAVHEASRSLYSIVHSGGGRGTHKDPGGEIWVYDMRGQERLARFDVPNLLVPFLRPFVGTEPGGLMEAALGAVLPHMGIHSLVVTQDASPVLFLRHGEIGAVAVVDAFSGAHLRDIEETGLAGGSLMVP
jgi:methylamine dehydrogenase heavy chain